MEAQFKETFVFGLAEAWVGVLLGKADVYKSELRFGPDWASGHGGRQASK